LFLRQHDYWIIRYHGFTSLLKSTRGLYYLAVMLREPGREFHVLELVAYAMHGSSLAAAGAAKGPVRLGLYAGVPVLDSKAKAELKSRLNDLRQELNEAERFNDFQRKTRAQNELQAIAEYLASAIGLGGRDRKTSPEAERARSAVTKCIRKRSKKSETLSHHWVVTWLPGSKPDTSAPIIRTRIARLSGNFNPSCDRKSHNVTRKVTPKERGSYKSSARFFKTGGPELNSTKIQPKKIGVTNETNKYSHPCRDRSFELHGYHCVGGQPPLHQL
jgi:hypothetical protein